MPGLAAAVVGAEIGAGAMTAAAAPAPAAAAVAAAGIATGFTIGAAPKDAPIPASMLLGSADLLPPRAVAATISARVAGMGNGVPPAAGRGTEAVVLRAGRRARPARRSPWLTDMSCDIARRAPVSKEGRGEWI